MSFWKWSRTASSNATADATINWAEGQAPSSVNDSARAMMAAAAKFRDDISGAMTTGGTSTAYTVTSFQGFDTLANMNGAMIAFTPHTTSGATVTLNVDGLGGKPLRFAPGAANELPAGTLVQGTPYVATYYNAGAEWILQGLAGNPYNIPLGGLLEFTGTTAPNGSFVLPFGQAISRTTYAAYFALIGTTYGAGDGSTTFNVIDKRGRVSAGKDDMGGSAASRITSAGSSVDGATLGASGGAQTVTLGTANLPAYTPAGTINTPTLTAKVRNMQDYGSGTAIVGAVTNAQSTATDTTVVSSAALSFTGTAQGGTSTPVNKMPPTVIVNYLLRVL
jgi:microcystin-dependent protein